MTETYKSSTQKEDITPQEYAAAREVGRTYATDEFVTSGSAAQVGTATASAGQAPRGDDNQGERSDWSTTAAGDAPQTYPMGHNQAYATPAYRAAAPHPRYAQNRGYQPQRGSAPNVDTTERQIAVAAGGLLLLYSLLNRSRTSLFTGALGAALFWHGQSQRSPIYAALDVNTARRPLWGNGQEGQRHGREQGRLVWPQPAQSQARREPQSQQEPRGNTIEIERAVTIDKPAAELYAYWRQLENLPKFMHHLQKVEQTGEKRSQWEARLIGGLSVSWDADIVEDVANERIVWRTLPDAQVQQRGVVTFTPATGERGTVVKVDLRYTPPGGIIGETFAQLLNGITAQQIKDDISRFKSLMEAGEIATVEGQSSGRA